MPTHNDDIEKAAIKFGKSLNKLRKDLEKYRNKAATEDEREVWQKLLESLSVPNTEN